MSKDVLDPLIFLQLLNKFYVLLLRFLVERMFPGWCLF